MQIKALSAFAVSFIMFALSGYPGRADAAFSRGMTAFSCTESTVSQSADGDLVSHWAHFAGSGYTYYGPSASGDAICPVPNDTNLPKGSITDTTVYACDGSTVGKLLAKTCGQSIGATGLSCGAAVNNGANSVTGCAQLTITDFSPWQGLFNFNLPYILVTVPELQGGSASRVLAYNVWN